MLNSWRRRRRPGRAELIDLKHRLAGEIRMLDAELRSRQRSGRPTGDVQRRLELTRNRHFETRLEIDRAEFEQ